MNVLCKYKNFFGEPNKGVHKYRLFNIAIVDLVLTILVAYLISLYFKNSFKYVLLFMFLLGILFHRIFCVRTTIDKILFEKPENGLIKQPF
jgi:hypothetical protein